MIRIAIAALSIAATPTIAATPITGKWFTVEKDSIIEIASCGPKLCGRIARLLRPVQGGPPVDRNNTNAALKSRPLIGLPILSDFIDAGTLWTGTIYDPRSGKSYKSKVSRNPDGTLNVQGCIAFFCQTQKWTKAQ
jgi:uncharacterized protein (DUF2147 family)